MVHEELTAICPPAGVWTGDEQFYFVSPDEVSALKFAAPIREYVPEAWDCEDIAWETVIRWRLAFLPHTRSSGAGLACGVVVCRVLKDTCGYSVARMGRQMHALNCFRLTTGEWMIFDAQTGCAENLVNAVDSKKIEIFNIWL